MERQHILACDRLEGFLGDHTAVRVLSAVDDLREHAAGDRTGLRPCLRKRDEALCPQAFEPRVRKDGVHQHVREDLEGGGKLVGRRDEADGAALSPDVDRHGRTEQLQRVRQRISVQGLRSLAEQSGRE